MNVAKQPLERQPEHSEEAIRVVKVENRKTLNDFIRLPWSLYANDPMWVSPLLLERRMHLSPKNPYFMHAKFCSWVAYRNAKPVGRISAQIDQLHIDRHQDATGFFGMLEAENNGQLFRTLLNKAEAWLGNQGMQRVYGPFNLSINQELGLLVDGFDTPPSMMMGHACPYYAGRIEENGYHKTKDLLAYLINANIEMPAAAKAVMARSRNRIHIRNLNMSKFSR